VLKSLCNQEKFSYFFKELCLIISVLLFHLQLCHVSIVHLDIFKLDQLKGTHASVEEYYRMLYFEAIDLAIEAITDRFDQPGYRIYNNLENLILKTCKGQDYTDELRTACEFYGNGLDRQ